jgi:hypothetical protein
MTSVTIGWITAGLIAGVCYLAGWYGHERHVQRRRDLPRAIFTPPAPPLQLVQPWQTGPLGRHHVEVVTTHAMPVVQEHPS